MGYRDEREAERAHREQLERELGEAKRALEAHEHKDAQDARELARLRAEVEALTRSADAREHAPRRRPRRPVALAAVAALLVPVGLSVFTIVVRRARHTAPMPVAAAPAAVPRAPASRGVARFGAIVIASTGRADVPVGEGCIVDAMLAGRGVVDDVVVRCGDVLVYQRGMDGGVGVTTTSAEAREEQVAPGHFVHRVTWSESGQRSGPRPQIVLDTERGVARLWREGLEAFELQLGIDDRSAERVGDALGPTRVVAESTRLHLAARVTERRGEPPIGADVERCEVIVRPGAGGDLDHRVRVTCGAAVIYGDGTYGFARAILRDGLPVRVDDVNPTGPDGDPMLRFDLDERVMVVADEGWQVRFALEEHPRCDLDGTWSGTVGDAPVEVRFTEPDADCVRGVAAGTTSDGTRLVGRFGPGFATLLGDTRTAFALVRRE
ncbi:hypothetical protein [Sandaracinus amylolyticus]|uniref:Uncharacterized protein n=1 Tax=Sandaracinus amylolyticus TaxID=927083 RepID=A0A0F6W9R0_9BACT|nr:hypothetical protein [Sandaracinus amylolyticus]AKF10998.1 hypothetical protein DB32_008147 [Sandaracinus amylolyticus]